MNCRLPIRCKDHTQCGQWISSPGGDTEELTLVEAQVMKTKPRNDELEDPNYDPTMGGSRGCGACEHDRAGEWYEFPFGEQYDPDVCSQLC